jgi:hypothetical protein
MAFLEQFVLFSSLPQEAGCFGLWRSLLTYFGCFLCTVVLEGGDQDEREGRYVQNDKGPLLVEAPILRSHPTAFVVCVIARALLDTKDAVRGASGLENTRSSGPKVDYLTGINFHYE